MVQYKKIDTCTGESLRILYVLYVRIVYLWITKKQNSHWTLISILYSSYVIDIHMLLIIRRWDY